MTQAISNSYFSTFQSYFYNTTPKLESTADVTSRASEDTQAVSSTSIQSRQVTWAASIGKNVFGFSDSTVQAIDDAAMIAKSTGTIVSKAAEVCGQALSTKRKFAVMGAVAGIQIALRGMSVSNDSQDVMKSVTNATSSLISVAEGLIGLTAMASGSATGILPAVVAVSALTYGLMEIAEIASAQ